MLTHTIQENKKLLFWKINFSNPCIGDFSKNLAQQHLLIDY